MDGALVDKGLYGQVKSVTDPNGAASTVEYDPLGRKTLATAPDGSWTSMYYSPTGIVGSQYVRVDKASGISTWTYFDGYGRTIKEQKTGPDNRFIATQTKYNATGTVSQTSLPYFDGTETPRFTSFIYDDLGRAISATNPDTSTALSCFDSGAGVVVTIDPDGNRKRQSRDALGRLAKVEEYLGTYSACSPETGTVYATTTYQYDALGNLARVTDAVGNNNDAFLQELAQKLKRTCATGGAVSEHTIELQGDVRDRVRAFLQGLGYTVKG